MVEYATKPLPVIRTAPKAQNKNICHVQMSLGINNVLMNWKNCFFSRGKKIRQTILVITKTYTTFNGKMLLGGDSSPTEVSTLWWTPDNSHRTWCYYYAFRMRLYDLPKLLHVVSNKSINRTRCINYMENWARALINIVVRKVNFNSSTSSYTTNYTVVLIFVVDVNSTEIKNTNVTLIIPGIKVWINAYINVKHWTQLLVHALNLAMV